MPGAEGGVDAAAAAARRRSPTSTATAVQRGRRCMGRSVLRARMPCSAADKCDHASLLPEVTSLLLGGPMAAQKCEPGRVRVKMPACRHGHARAEALHESDELPQLTVVCKHYSLANRGVANWRP